MANAMFFVKLFAQCASIPNIFDRFVRFVLFHTQYGVVLLAICLCIFNKYSENRCEYDSGTCDFINHLPIANSLWSLDVPDQEEKKKNEQTKNNLLNNVQTIYRVQKQYEQAKEEAAKASQETERLLQVVQMTQEEQNAKEKTIMDLQQ